MSSHYKLPSGKHRFQIDLMGVRESRTFVTKKEGQGWADKTETEIRAGSYRTFPKKTFRDALERYRDHVSTKKSGSRWEANRINAMIRDHPALVAKIFHEVDTPDMAAWRDIRLKVVSGGTVAREINLFSNVFKVGQREWKWRGPSPITDMKKPGDNPGRHRRPTRQEVKAICRYLGYRTGHVQTKSQQVAFAFLLALRNGMRVNEIWALSDETVDYERRVATIERHKTLEIDRDVRRIPLLPQTLRLLGYVRGRGRYFTVTAASRDTLFRKACQALMIEGLTFRDSRADLFTRLADADVPVMQLAQVSGHKNLNTLYNKYYRSRADKVAVLIANRIKPANGARSN
jgi:integrase